MVIKERTWTIKNRVKFTHESPSSNISQLSNGTLETYSDSWANGGNSVEEFKGDCKVVWNDPLDANTLPSELTRLGLAYQDFTSGSASIDYRIQYSSAITHYTYYYPGCGSSSGVSSTVNVLSGDKPVVERKDGRIYIYIIRSNGAIEPIGDWAETNPGIPMKAAYVGFYANTLIDINFYSALSYRFAFNGMEHDNETYGQGNAYDFGARIYDSRLGRFMSTDPLSPKYPSFSTYQFAYNCPITFIDLDGLEGELPEVPTTLVIRIQSWKSDVSKETRVIENNTLLIVASDITSANEKLISYLKENTNTKQFDNVIIMAHGVTQYTKNKEGEKVPTGLVSLSLDAYNMDKINRENIDGPDIEDSQNSLTNILSTVREEGNCVILACGLANDEETVEAIYGLFSQAGVKLFTDADVTTGKVSKETTKLSDGDVVTEGVQIFTTPSNYGSGWSMTTSSSDGSVKTTGVGELKVDTQSDPVLTY